MDMMDVERKAVEGSMGTLGSYDYIIYYVFPEKHPSEVSQQISNGHELTMTHT
jgi:hypothetical protein